MKRTITRLLKKILVIGLVINAFELVIFAHYNHLLALPATPGAKANPTTQVTTTTTSAKVDDLVQIANIAATHIAVSSDHQYVAYSDGTNHLVIQTLQGKKTVVSKTETQDIIYLKWITDRSLFVGLKQMNPTSSNLILDTIDVSSGTQRLVYEFKGTTKISRFIGVTFSPYTNDVYTLIGNSTITKMYRFDTMSYLHDVPLNVKVAQNPMMFQSGGAVFYEDMSGTVWELLGGVEHKFLTHSTLISVNSDTLYYGSLNSKGQVVAVHAYASGKSSLLQSLSTPAAPGNILVRSDGSVLVNYGSTFYDSSTKKNINLPANATAIMTSNGMFVTDPQGTYWVNGS